VVVRRVTGEKALVPVERVVGTVTAALEADQQALYDEALRRQERRTVEVASMVEAMDAAATGWAKLPWSAVGPAGETELNAQGLTVRCLVRANGGVPDSEDEPDLVAVVGRAY
jgi:prolyl-tRNA synthetase